MKEKIFITGTSGIGKTTLAKDLSVRLGIPFINGSSSVLWKEYGITSHRELLEMNYKDPDKAFKFQHDLLLVREDATKGLDSFITDRSIIDNIVYFLYQNSTYLSREVTENYLELCRQSYKRMFPEGSDDFRLIYMPRYTKDNIPDLEDDSKRIANPYFQNVMDEIFRYVISDYDIHQILLNKRNYLNLDIYNFETRVRNTVEFLNI